MAFIVDRYFSKRDREYIVNEALVFNADKSAGLSRRPDPSEFPAGETRGNESSTRLVSMRQGAGVSSSAIAGGEPFESPMRKITEGMCMAFSRSAQETITRIGKRRVSLDFPDTSSCRGCFSICLVSEMMTRRFGLGFLSPADASNVNLGQRVVGQ